MIKKNIQLNDVKSHAKKFSSQLNEPEDATKYEVVMVLLRKKLRDIRKRLRRTIQNKEKIVKEVKRKAKQTKY